MTCVKRYEDINLDEFNYTKPIKFNNSYFGQMGMGTNNEPIYIQTPKIRVKTNIKEVLQQKVPYLEVIIPKNKLDFYDFFINIDDKNIKTTFSKSEEWFGKALPLEAIDEMHKPLTKGFKKNSEPTIRYKIPILKGKVQCSVYNQSRSFIDINEIKENDEVILILHLKGLKVLKQNYFCECYITQIKLFQEKDLKYNIIENYSIIDDNEEITDIFDEEIMEVINEKEKEKIEQNLKIQKLKDELISEENNLVMKKKLLEDLENN